jgi:penicillin amidase
LQNASDLPLTLNPSEGYIVSANNRPSKDDPVVGMVFSPNDRVDRMRTMIEARASVGVPDLIQLQRDVYSRPAQELAKYLSILLSGSSGEKERIKQALENWDGRYETDSNGALIFELMLSQVVERTLSARGEPELKGSYSQWGFLIEYLRSDLATLPESDRRDLVAHAAQEVASMEESGFTWGQVHRLSLGHPLMGIPLLGRFFVEYEAPSAGSRETLMKSAHGFVEGVHDAQFGAQSRHISDLSDPDSNYFVLLGGQDGFLGSTTFLDQVPLWERGEFIRMPLTLEVIEDEFDAAIFRY